MSGLLRIIAVLFELLFFWTKKKHSDESERLEEVERFQQDATNRNEPAVQSQFARWRTAARIRRNKRL
ncbi:hypothetical protein [Gimesia chilikensis]|jgi:hypothetical protein|uniref:hypothetical protein n=1 Tax=Gimesia chilikensis TaxID=2605989 RepID=UPI0011896FCA|nr:hypothetical protein [Gimesia chilikensis]QDT84594.1 hypothetical protein MalM14_22540 [Gimesia chilikensis]